MQTDAALDQLRQIEGFTDATRDNVELERLGGLTNIVFRVSKDGAEYLLRIPGPGTEEYINRAVEAHNAEAAAKAGVSPKVLHFDTATGVMLAGYVDAPTMSPERFLTTEGAPARAGEAFRKLHQSGEAFEFRFELFSMIDEYLRVLGEKSATLPEGYNETVKEAEKVREALEATPAALAPCHCDPLCENFLDDGSKMWIVDWEYSGMNDPLWDLGDLSVEAGFEDKHDLEMLKAYCGGDPSPATFSRMVIYKAMCDLLWTLWGLIQHADGNPAEDFWAYSEERFARCRRLMADPKFVDHVRTVRAG